MNKLTGEEERVKEIVKETLNVFSKTTLDIESNREIVAETIAKELINKPKLNGRAI